ncbi:MAG: hypothetical protein V1821_00640 [bacterium]
MNIIWFAAILLTLLIFAYGAVRFAPFVPTRKRDLNRILKLAQPKPGLIFFELGSGDGRVTDAFAKAGARATGVELAWPLYIVSLLRSKLSGSGAKFLCRDLFGMDLSHAQAVFFFAMPESIEKRLKPKLERELQPGTLVISYVFPVAGWEPRTIDKPSDRDLPIYTYYWHGRGAT